jgi:hypothetical protein
LEKYDLEKMMFENISVDKNIIKKEWEIRFEESRKDNIKYVKSVVLK